MVQYDFSRCSEEVVVFGALDLVVVSTKGLPDIVRVERILGGTLLLSAGISLGEHFPAGKVVLLEHFDCKNVINLDVMGRQTVLEVVGREHHAVTRVPELRLVLLVECQHVAVSDEAELGQNHGRGHPPDEDTRVVEWAILHAHKPGQVLALHSHNMVHHNPIIVDHLRKSEQTVVPVLPLADLEELEQASDCALSLSKSLVDHVLESLCVAEQERL